MMLKLGIEIMPNMPLRELVDTVKAAEDLGYTYCLVTDEGFLHDVYIALAAIAQNTTRIMLGPVTNGYTRHPAVTASAIVSLNELSVGRALVTVVPGGSMVLPPMGISREHPLGIVSETIQILRLLWTGEPITWHGEHFKLENAQIGQKNQEIPIWLAARGERMLKLAGEQADGVILMPKCDLKYQISQLNQGEQNRSIKPKRIYLDRMAYTQAMLEEAKSLYIYMLLDSPPRVLRAVGLSEQEIISIKTAYQNQGLSAAADLVKHDMIRQYQVAGTPEECRLVLKDLIQQYHLDVFLMDIVSPGLAANIQIMKDIVSIAC